MCSSPSPPPQYDPHGRRTNTREYRYRRKLEAERHQLVRKATNFFPNYLPPADYRLPVRTHEKVYIPVNDYPEINFSKLTPLLVVGPTRAAQKKSPPRLLLIKPS